MTAVQDQRRRGKPRAAAQVTGSNAKPKRVAGTTHQNSADPRSEFGDEAWNDMVATAAYFRAEARGFEGGSAEDDWYEAEAELRERLARAEEGTETVPSPDASPSDIESEGE